MFHVLKNIRDFIDPESMKFNLDEIQSRNLLTIDRMEKGTDGVHRKVMHVFTATGTYIGTIYNPEYLPTNEK